MTAENKEIGFIKIYRSITTWDWWDDINTFRLFITILLMANYKSKNWRGKKIERGSFWTSLETLSERSGLSVRQVRVSLDKLILTNEVTSEVTNSGRLITVVNYGFYQDNDESVTNEMTSDTAHERQTNDKRVTTTKERKKEKKDKEYVCMCATTTKEFWNFLTPKDIDKIYEKFPNSGGYLIDEVARDAVDREVEIKSPYRYILGYARRKNWDDNADHFEDAIL